MFVIGCRLGGMDCDKGLLLKVVVFDMGMGFKMINGLFVFLMYFFDMCVVDNILVFIWFFLDDYGLDIL